MSRPSLLQVNPPFEIFTVCFEIFLSVILVQIQVRFWCEDVLIFCDVRSEYMSAHVRIDSSGSVGFPFPCFVCCGWFGLGNKLLLLKG